jgi:hypothetical protein
VPLLSWSKLYGEVLVTSNQETVDPRGALGGVGDGRQLGHAHDIAPIDEMS